MLSMRIWRTANDPGYLLDSQTSSVSLLNRLINQTSLMQFGHLLLIGSIAVQNKLVLGQILTWTKRGEEQFMIDYLIKLN